MPRPGRTSPGRQPEHPEAGQIRLGSVLSALADPIRLRIVSDLARGHQDMACISFELPVSKSTSTHHFRVLREAGIIRQYYEGTSRMSRLRTPGTGRVFPRPVGGGAARPGRAGLSGSGRAGGG